MTSRIKQFTRQILRKESSPTQNSFRSAQEPGTHWRRVRSKPSGRLRVTLCGSVVRVPVEVENRRRVHAAAKQAWPWNSCGSIRIRYPVYGLAHADCDDAAARQAKSWDRLVIVGRPFHAFSKWLPEAQATRSALRRQLVTDSVCIRSSINAAASSAGIALPNR